MNAVQCLLAKDFSTVTIVIWRASPPLNRVLRATLVFVELAAKGSGVAGNVPIPESIWILVVAGELVCAISFGLLSTRPLTPELVAMADALIALGPRCGGVEGLGKLPSTLFFFLPKCAQKWAVYPLAQLATHNLKYYLGTRAT